MLKIKLFILLMLFSSIANATTINQLISNHGKKAIIKFISKRTSDGVTINFNGVIKKAYSPASNYVTANTIKKDLARIGLTANQVEKIIADNKRKETEKEQQRYEARLKSQQRTKERAEREQQEAVETFLKEKVSYRPPSNVRSLIKNHLNNTLFDPYSVRDLKISSPKTIVLKKDVSGLSKGQRVTFVSVSYNAKNRLGAYTGKKNYSYIFRGQRLIGVIK